MRPAERPGRGRGAPLASEAVRTWWRVPAVAALTAGWAVLLVDAVRDLAADPSFAAVLRLVVEAVAAVVTVVALAPRRRPPTASPDRDGGRDRGRAPGRPGGEPAGGDDRRGSGRAGGEPAGGEGGQQAQPGHDRQDGQRTG